MLERLNGSGAGSDAIEWRPARPDDGPVWVALRREGQMPLVPREALAEPGKHTERDRDEQGEELRRFLEGPPPNCGERFLLWRASRPVGRLCFKLEDRQASIEGLALLPSLGPDVTRRVAQMAIERAREAEVDTITAAYEARHAFAFAVAGFRERRRHIPMMAATRLVEEDEEEMEPVVINTLYQVEPINNGVNASILLSEFYRAVYGDGREEQRGSPTLWLNQMAQVLDGTDNTALMECSFVAVFRTQAPSLSRFAGVTMVNRWQGAAVIDDLLVLPRYRRLGIGSALVRQTMLSLRERGYASVMIVVRGGASGRQFYRQLGFREVQPIYIEGERMLR